MRPGFGLGGMTHSLLVMVKAGGCGTEAGDAVVGEATPLIAADALMGGWMPAAVGRIAIGGAVEDEEDEVAGVEPFDGEDAEVGMGAELDKA